jgi:disulfide oxidoreductase YuzD
MPAPPYTRIIHLIKECIYENKVRDAERWLHALLNPKVTVTEYKHLTKKVTKYRSRYFPWEVPKYLSEPNAAVVFVHNAYAYLKHSTETDEIVQAALAKVATEHSFVFFATINQRIARAIILEFINRVEGEETNA